MTDHSHFAASLQSIQERIHDACAAAGRDPAAIEIVAITKTLPLDSIRKACALGIRRIGENRVQEAVEKFGDGIVVREFPATAIHMIGHLQSNKVRKALTVVHSVDSVDTPELAQSLDRHAGVHGRRCRVLLEVNTSGEPQKSGLEDDDVLAVAERVLSCRNLDMAGLMTVGPNTTDPHAIRGSFRQLRRCYERVERTLAPPAWRVLSMGMSGDFEIAIAEGATEIRLGTALFGERRQP